MLGDWIKAERTIRGWSQRELKERTGLAQAYLSRLERNLHPAPSFDALARLANAFELPLTDVLRAAGYVDEPPPVDPLVAELQRLLPALSTLERQEIMDLLALIRLRRARKG